MANGLGRKDEKGSRDLETIDNRTKKGKNRKPRMTNLELLRCVAMMMVVVLHYLGKGNLLGDVSGESMSAVGVAAWLFESFCIVAVNVYMLISGYFLCESHFKWSRLIGLVCQVWFYSVVVGLAAAAFHLVPAEQLTTNYYVQLFFPIMMGHYWFLTAYIFLYLLLPLVTMAVKRMTEGQLRGTILLLLFVFTVSKSVLPVRLDMDAKGYDMIWYLCMFLVAAYLRKFGVPFWNKKSRSLCLYVVGSLCVFGEVMALHVIYCKTGKLGLLLTVSTEYNHIFPVLASVGLFAFFLKVKVPDRMGKFICRIAPYTLGVYLLHENSGVRYLWPKWLGAERIASVGGLLLGTCIAVAVVFTAGIIVDYLRNVLMGGVHSVLLHCPPYRNLAEKIAGMDDLWTKAGQKT